MRKSMSETRMWRNLLSDEFLQELHPATVRMVQNAAERRWGTRPGWKLTREIMRERGYLLNRARAISIGLRSASEPKHKERKPK